MNAEGLLRKQGWRGAGFSLDTTDRGIKKPLLISHKQDQLGLGKKKASHTTDDQWWMRAFDESLQNLGSGKTSTLSQIQEKGINRGGLYGFFVKGEGLQGSIGVESSAPTSGTTTPPTSTGDSDSDKDSDSDSTSSDDTASEPSETIPAKKGQNKRKREIEEHVRATKKLKQGADGVKINARAQASTKSQVQTPIGSIRACEWPKLCTVPARIDKVVKVMIKKNEKAGAYEDVMDVDDPKKSGKTLGKKATQQQRQKVIRAAKKQMTKELVVKAIVDGDLPMLNPEKWSERDILENYRKIAKTIKAVKKAAKKANKTSSKAGKKVNGVSSKETRKAKREDRKEAKAKIASENARSKTAAQQQPAEQSAVEAHLSQLTPEKQVDYAARAAEKGQTLEEYTLRRIEKKDAKRGGKEPEIEMEEVVPTDKNNESEKAQRVSNTEQKEESAMQEGNVRDRQKASEKEKARSAKKVKGNSEGAAKNRIENKTFMEKAAKFGAVAKPIAASA